MSTKVLITGDRRMDPLAAVSAVAAAVTMLAAQHSDLKFLVGDLEFGVERAARYLLPHADLFVYDRTPEDKPDFRPTFERLLPDIDAVVFLHPAPGTSHIGRALLEAIPEGKLFMPEFN